MRDQIPMCGYINPSTLSDQPLQKVNSLSIPMPFNGLILGYDSHSLPSHTNHSSLPSHRRPQSGDWTHLPSSMDSLTLDDMKEPSSSSSNGFSSRRHTVHIQRDSFSHPKVPARTQAAIEKVAEIVNKMGGEVRTHVQDNGGSSTFSLISTLFHFLLPLRFSIQQIVYLW